MFILSSLVIALVGCGTSSGVSSEPALPTTASPAAITTVRSTGQARSETTTGPTTTTSPPTTTTTGALTITRVVDGDTVDVSTGDIVRLIGIDTPEAGECGYREATNRLLALVGGQIVTLEAGARDDADRYGRLLRYVLVDGVDSGGVLVAEGFAQPRYNSTDGYGAHRREAEYAAEARPSSVCNLAPATTASATPMPTTASGAQTVPTSTAPPTAVYYTSCSAARAAGAAPLYRGEPGYRSGLDGDGDGVACE
jgi:endonuclease YncB( thermonuclease family)